MRRLILEEPISRAAANSRRVAVFACMTAAVAVFVGRVEGRPAPPRGLTVFGAALALAALALLLAGAAAVEIWNTGRRGVARAAAAPALALGLLAYPVYLTAQAARLTRINEVTTDFKAPPTYMISSRAREARGAWTPPDPAPEFEAEQRVAYPRIAPMQVDLEPDQAYRMSLRIAKDLGWRIVDALPPNLRGDGAAHIDAIDRSLFFGFVDDIAIRIRPQANQTQIDIRSASRIGRHDFGANARGGERFIEAVRQSG